MKRFKKEFICCSTVVSTWLAFVDDQRVGPKAEDPIQQRLSDLVQGEGPTIVVCRQDHCRFHWWPDPDVANSENGGTLRKG